MSQTHARSHRTAPLCALALGVFACGVLIYLAERDPARVWLMPSSGALAWLRGVLPAVVRDSGPSFVHVYVFSVFTALCLGPGVRSTAAACGGWFAADALFEAGQYAPIARALTDLMPPRLADSQSAGWFTAYFLNGTFDAADVAAAALGAAAAAATLGFGLHEQRRIQ